MKYVSYCQLQRTWGREPPVASGASRVRSPGRPTPPLPGLLFHPHYKRDIFPAPRKNKDFHVHVRPDTARPWATSVPV